MEFAFTDDQKMLRDTVRDVLERECPPEVVRAVWEGRGARSEEVWSTLADTGLIGMTASEAAGGMSMTELEWVLPHEEIGYAAVPGPYVDTVAVGIPILDTLGTDAHKSRWLGPAVSGKARIVVAFEGQTRVPFSEGADVLIAQRGGESFCVPWSDVSTRSEPSVDRARQLVSIEFDPSDAYRMRSDKVSWSTAKDRATLATAAVLAGLSRRMLDMTVQYAKDREQFGKPIGAQQAVKHRLADALIQQEFARPMVYKAAWSMATAQTSASIDVSVAKIYASDAAKFVARQALQVHGAIGYTIECDLHMWMKRTWALAAALGDSAFHRGRVAEHILGTPET
ncbi:MAG: acyl-CoA dehydrogenase family protein [Myxococcota bacterium]